MRPLPYERRILLLALAAGGVSTLVALLLLWFGNFSPKEQWTLTVVIVVAWLSFAFSAEQRVAFPDAHAFEFAGRAARGRFFHSRARRESR